MPDFDIIVIGAGPAGRGSCPGGRKASASEIRRTRRDAQRSVLLLASSIMVAFLATANAPSPLYERYETAWHASPLIGTIAFAAYAVAVIVGLLWLKELPALLGRRAVLLGAIAGQILALVLFAVAGSFALIVVGRVLQGLASGAALGTLSAAMVESDAERGTAASAASPGAGSGSGALLSGLVVQFLPGPRQTIYLILAAILAIQALFVLRVMPRGLRRPLSWKAVSPRVAVPADAKPTFMSTAPVVFAVWGLSGFYAALSPALYRALSRSDSVWRSALPLFALLAAATATTIVLRRLNGRAQTIIGAVAMLVGLGITVAAIESGSTSWPARSPAWDSAQDFKARCAAWRRKQQRTSVRRCCPRSSWSPTSGWVYRRSSPAP
jgi:MFS family permease